MTEQAATDTTTEPAYALIELFGHRQVAGAVREVERYGGRMLRLDVPAIDGRPATTHYYAGGAIYGEHPCDQATAERLAADLYQPPAHQLALGAGDTSDPWRGGDQDEDDASDNEGLDGPF